MPSRAEPVSSRGFASGEHLPDLGAPGSPATLCRPSRKRFFCGARLLFPLGHVFKSAFLRILHVRRATGKPTLRRRWRSGSQECVCAPTFRGRRICHVRLYEICNADHRSLGVLGGLVWPAMRRRAGKRTSTAQATGGPGNANEREDPANNDRRPRCQGQPATARRRSTSVPQVSSRRVMTNRPYSETVGTGSPHGASGGSCGSSGSVQASTN